MTEPRQLERQKLELMFAIASAQLRKLIAEVAPELDTVFQGVFHPQAFALVLCPGRFPRWTDLLSLFAPDCLKATIVMPSPLSLKAKLAQRG